MKKYFLIMALTIFAANAFAQHIELPAPGEGLDLPLQKVLSSRQTNRDLMSEEIPLEMLSSVLWSANGVNRPDGKRTAPSARNAQEIDVYVALPEGIYLYNALENSLELVVKGDYRATISQQKHFQVAPIALLLVANYDKMKDFDTDSRNFYSATDCGYVSQNIYMACASLGIGTVACGAIERDKLAKIMNLKNGKVMLAHPIGRIH